MIETLENRSFFDWVPPAIPGSFTVNFGIFSKVTVDMPLVLLYDPTSQDFIQWTLDADYTITEITAAFFRINFTQDTIDKYTIPGTLVVSRNTAFTQGKQFEEGDEFPVKEVSSALDKLTMISQDVKDIFDLSIRVPFTDMYDNNFNPIIMSALPDIENRKDKWLYFDSNGNPTAVKDINTGNIPFSEWGRELVNKPDAEAGRDHMESAYKNGNVANEFLVAESLDENSAVPLKTLTESVENLFFGGNLNLIDNAQFYISQRGFIDAGEQSVTKDEVFFDRWKVLYGGDSVINTRAFGIRPQLTDARPYKSQRISIVTASTGIGDDQRVGIQHTVEDRKILSVQNSIVTFGVWVRSTVAVTAPDKLCIALIDGTGANSYVHEYEIEAGVWTYITFSVDLSPIQVLSCDGSPGLQIVLCLGAGTNLRGAVNDEWYSGKAYATDNQIDYSSVTGAKFLFANAALVLGEDALPVDGTINLYRPYRDEFTSCQRFLRLFDFPQFVSHPSDFYYEYLRIPFHFDSEMAAIPSFSGLENPVSVRYADNTTLPIFNLDDSVLRKDGGYAYLKSVHSKITSVETVTITNMTEGYKWFLSCEL